MLPENLAIVVVLTIGIIEIHGTTAIGAETTTAIGGAATVMTNAIILATSAIDVHHVSRKGVLDNKVWNAARRYS